MDELSVGELLELAKINLQTDGHLIPTFILSGSEGLIFMDVSQVFTPKGKRAFVWLLGQTLGYGFDVREFWTINDAYVRSIDMEGDDIDAVLSQLPTTGLIDDPKAEECIVITEMKDDGAASGAVLPYERTTLLEKTIIEYKDVENMKEGATEATILSLFWRGKEAGERIILRAYEEFNLTPDMMFEDSGLTALEAGKRAARRAAVKMFGANIVSS